MAIAVCGSAFLGAGAAVAADQATFDRMLRDSTTTGRGAPVVSPGPVELAPVDDARSYSFDRFLSEGTPTFATRAAAPAPLAAAPAPAPVATSFSGFFNERYPLDLQRPQPAALVPAGTATRSVQLTQPTVIVEAPAPAVAPPPPAAPVVTESGHRTVSPVVEGRKFGPQQTASVPVTAVAEQAAVAAPPAKPAAPDARRL
ncbi:MAG: hypothetical protein FJX53_04330, partial [Alphaproteobacteria bacterium]|nr:hypothetical protein [Alphaproteobacteria bacterium]